MSWLCSRCGTHYAEQKLRCSKDSGLVVENLAGRVLAGRYELESLLGVGGMDATVWKARQRSMEREVAVKVLPALDQKSAERFARGARIASRLNHPNITTVHDYGQTTDHKLFLVMERLVGRTLRHDVSGHQAVEPVTAVQMATHVLRALEHAHEQHVVHRDLKPDNLFVTSKDEVATFVKVLDFGIAKYFTEESSATSVPVSPEEGWDITQGQFLPGTPLYMAPEQINDERVDARTDFYALGAVLFQLLTGHVPFTGKTKFEVLGKHLRDQPRAFSLVRPDIIYPEGLEALVLQALAKSPDERFQTAREMRHALRDVMGASGIYLADSDEAVFRGGGVPRVPTPAHGLAASSAADAVPTPPPLVQVAGTDEDAVEIASISDMIELVDSEGASPAEASVRTPPSESSPLVPDAQEEATRIGLTVAPELLDSEPTRLTESRPRSRPVAAPGVVVDRAPPELDRTAERRPAWVPAAVAIAGLLIIGAVGLIWWSSERSQAAEGAGTSAPTEGAAPSLPASAPGRTPAPAAKEAAAAAAAATPEEKDEATVAPGEPPSAPAAEEGAAAKEGVAEEGTGAEEAAAEGGAAEETAAKEAEGITVIDLDPLEPEPAPAAEKVRQPRKERSREARTPRALSSKKAATKAKEPPGTTVIESGVAPAKTPAPSEEESTASDGSPAKAVRVHILDTGDERTSGGTRAKKPAPTKDQGPTRKPRVRLLDDPDDSDAPSPKPKPKPKPKPGDGRKVKVKILGD